MKASLMLRTFRMARRILLPRDVASDDEAEAVATAASLAADAGRRGPRATFTYWRTEFTSLLRAAVAARRRDPQLPDDLVAVRRRLPMLSTVLHDARYALRVLRRAPGFTAVAVLTLALGIGANTAIFSLINGVLLQPLPYPRADRLYRVLHGEIDDPTSLASMTPGNFYDLQRESTAMKPFAAVTRITPTLTGHGEPRPVPGMRSAGSILEVVGVPPMLGRIYTDRDDMPGAEPVMVLSHSTWMRLFGGDEGAIGQALVLDGRPVMVVGVMPAGFHFPAPDVEFWMPALFPDTLRASRTEFMLGGIGRLADGRDATEANAELQTIMARLRADHPQANSNVAIVTEPLQEAIVGSVRTPLWILMASVACVLLIACANLANLMLARAADRRREVAVRQAIGAGRLHLVRQLLVESLVLGLAGGIAGLLTGYAFLNALIAWLPPGTPRLEAVTLDASVLAFTLIIAIGSSVCFGLAPALQLAGNAPVTALKEGSANATARSLLRPALVVCEIAVALVLLAGAGLLLRSFQALQQVDPGFPIDRVLTLGVSLPQTTYPRPAERIAFVNEALERLGRLPGVEAVAAGSGVPLAGRGTGAWFNMYDRPVPPGQTPPGVPYRVVTPRYFETLGIRLLRGRLLSDRDGLDGTPSVVISESVASRFWPEGQGRDAIGAEIYLGAPGNRLFDRATVVGIVKDVKLAGLDSGMTEAVYATQTLMPFWRGFTFAIRTTGDPAALASAARHELRQIDAAMPVMAVRTMDDVLEGSMAPARSSMLLLTIFASVALAMAAVGVFGVLSFTVTRRSREMGIRMALGADATAVRWLVVRDGMRQAAAGIAVGLIGAFWLTGFMSTLLFQVAPRDPITFAGAALILTAVSALACYLPARRATRVNPLVVLRAD